MHVSADRPLFRKLDNLLLRVADLDAAISFYGDRLGHPVLWRSDEAVGFALPDTNAELVAHLNVGPESDVLVDDVDEAFAAFLSAGGEAAQRPFDTAIGRCARVRDPLATIWFCWTSPKARWRLTTKAGSLALSQNRRPANEVAQAETGRKTDSPARCGKSPERSRMSSVRTLSSGKEEMALPAKSSFERSTERIRRSYIVQ